MRRYFMVLFKSLKAKSEIWKIDLPGFTRIHPRFPTMGYHASQQWVIMDDS